MSAPILPAADAPAARSGEVDTIDLPVARCAVDVWLPHLDRPFDYSVPASEATRAVPGARLRVRFAGRTVDGFVLDRVAASDAPSLAPLQRVVSDEPVLSPAQVRLIRAVADHYAGTFADVMRLAVPPRHAATERATPRPWPEPRLDGPVPPTLSATPLGAGFLAALGRGEAPRAFWQVPASMGAEGAPGWIDGIAEAVVATLRAGRGVAVIVPDVRDVARVKARLGEVVGERAIAELHASLGPSARYRNYLAVARGHARVVVGTRAAAFAPVADLGLVAVWDDGNDLHEEVRAPYHHVRTVAALRSTIDGAALLFAAHARSCEVQLWLERGWLSPISHSGAELRRRGPAVRVSADSDVALERDPLAARVRLPALVFTTIRAGLATGPVLVQVPRGGHGAGLRCDRCEHPVRCSACGGPMRQRGGTGQIECGWCGRIEGTWRCPECSSPRWRAPVVGAARTSEELGRAFPGVRVLESSHDRVIDEVGADPALVVCTPGAEPVAAGGYAAGVILDAGLTLARPDLRAAEEAFRRWVGAVALVRPGAEGGTVAVVGPARDRAVQALVRLDPAGFAERELADRAQAGFPPAVRLATVDGEIGSLRSLVAHAGLPASAQLLGPVELPAAGPAAQNLSRLMVRVPPDDGRLLAPALKAAQAIRSAHKEPGAVRVRIDPVEIG